MAPRATTASSTSSSSATARSGATSARSADFFGTGSICISPRLGPCARLRTLRSRRHVAALHRDTEASSSRSTTRSSSRRTGVPQQARTRVTFDLGGLTGDSGNPVFVVHDRRRALGNGTEMPWQGFSPQLPSLFALLADPSVVVDGLDQVFQAIPEPRAGTDLRLQAAAARRPAREQPAEQRDRRLPHEPAPAAREPPAREQRRGRRPRAGHPAEALQRDRAEWPRHPAAVQRRRARTRARR